MRVPSKGRSLSRRDFLRGTGMAALGLSAACASLRSRNAAKPPNIVLIFADDLGYGDLSCYGSEIPTPNIDSLAREGVLFTDWYVSAPSCTPSRYSLLTGQVPDRSLDRLMGPLLTERDGDQNRGIRPGETTLATLLKQCGYRTAIVGKWHLGHGSKEFWPTRHGFDSFYGLTTGAIDYFTHTYRDQPDWWRDETPIEEEGYSTDLITAEAVRIIETQPPGQPLFLYLPYNAVHTGKQTPSGPLMQAKPEDIEQFRHIEDETRRLYAAVLKCLDDGVGRVLAALDAKGIRDNTWVLFISDNGGAERFGASNGPFTHGKGKGTYWEAGIRVPCLMRWPGRIKSGAVSSQPASCLDVLPTVCALLDIDTADMTLDGVDLRACIFEGKPVKRDLFWGHWGRVQGFQVLRRGPWKYIKERGTGPLLFNLEDDPAEVNDLSARMPDKLRELQAAHALIRATLPERPRP